MARALIAYLAIALVACRARSTPTPTPTVDAAPPPPPVAVIDAAPPAPAPAPGPAFVLQGRGRDIAKIYALEDGLAVFQTSNAATPALLWKITTLQAGKQPVVVVPKRATTNFDESFHDALWGTTSNVFVGLFAGNVLRGSAKGAVTIPKHYRHVVELRRGQWLGLRSNESDITYNDSDPVHYDLLAGTGDVIVVPSHVRPRELAVHLGEGRICAEAVMFDTSLPRGIWTADVEGHQHIALLEGTFLLFRGADGECQAVTTAQTRGEEKPKYAVVRIQGDKAETPVPFEVDGLARPTADREGGVWYIDKASVPQRIVVTNAKVTTTPYPIPDKVEGCDHPQASEVAASGPNDVWVTASCLKENGEYDPSAPELLLHTGPRLGEVVTWPGL